MGDPRSRDFFGVEYGNSSVPQAPRLEASLVVPYNIGIVWKDSSGNYWAQYLEDLGNGSPTLKVRQVNIP